MRIETTSTSSPSTCTDCWYERKQVISFHWSFSNSQSGFPKPLQPPLPAIVAVIQHSAMQKTSFTRLKGDKMKIQKAAKKHVLVMARCILFQIWFVIPSTNIRYWLSF